MRLKTVNSFNVTTPYIKSSVFVLYQLSLSYFIEQCINNRSELYCYCGPSIGSRMLYWLHYSLHEPSQHHQPVSRQLCKSHSMIVTKRFSTAMHGQALHRALFCDYLVLCLLFQYGSLSEYHSSYVFLLCCPSQIVLHGLQYSSCRDNVCGGETTCEQPGMSCQRKCVSTHCL